MRLTADQRQWLREQVSHHRKTLELTNPDEPKCGRCGMPRHERTPGCGACYDRGRLEERREADRRRRQKKMAA